MTFFKLRIQIFIFLSFLFYSCKTKDKKNTDEKINPIIDKNAQTNKPKWGMMEVLNPDVLSYLDFDENEEVPSEQELENGHQTSEALKTPGMGKHRTDFISAPIR